MRTVLKDTLEGVEDVEHMLSRHMGDVVAGHEAWGMKINAAYEGADDEVPL